jgi:hypothetical protein
LDRDGFPLNPFADERVDQVQVNAALTDAAAPPLQQLPETIRISIRTGAGTLEYSDLWGYSIHGPAASARPWAAMVESVRGAWEPLAVEGRFANMGFLGAAADSEQLLDDLPAGARDILRVGVQQMLLAREGVLFPRMKKGGVVNFWSRKLYDHRVAESLASTRRGRAGPRTAAIDWQLGVAMGTFPEHYLPHASTHILNQRVADAMSEAEPQPPRPARIFLSLFSPRPADVKRMQSTTINAPALSFPKLTMEQRSKLADEYSLDRSLRLANGSEYQVLWGAMSCGVHTVIRTATPTEE